MSMIWVPVHGMSPMDCTVPSASLVIRLIHWRPNSPAKKSPSYASGNLTGESSAGS